jgi:hypothetical protein
MTMPELDEIIHQPVRLRLMAALVAIKSGESAEFTFLREAGYIESTKTFVDRKPHTYVSATTAGRKVFRNQVAALEEILKGSGGLKGRK